MSKESFGGSGRGGTMTATQSSSSTINRVSSAESRPSSFAPRAVSGMGKEFGSRISAKDGGYHMLQAKVAMRQTIGFDAFGRVNLDTRNSKGKAFAGRPMYQRSTETKPRHIPGMAHFRVYEQTPSDRVVPGGMMEKTQWIKIKPATDTRAIRNGETSRKTPVISAKDFQTIAENKATKAIKVPIINKTPDIYSIPVRTAQRIPVRGTNTESVHVPVQVKQDIPVRFAQTDKTRIPIHVRQDIPERFQNAEKVSVPVRINQETPVAVQSNAKKDIPVRVTADRAERLARIRNITQEIAKVQKEKTYRPQFPTVPVKEVARPVSVANNISQGQREQKAKILSPQDKLLAKVLKRVEQTDHKPEYVSQKTRVQEPYMVTDPNKLTTKHLAYVAASPELHDLDRYIDDKPKAEDIAKLVHTFVANKHNKVFTGNLNSVEVQSVMAQLQPEVRKDMEQAVVTRKGLMKYGFTSSQADTIVCTHLQSALERKGLTVPEVKQAQRTATQQDVETQQAIATQVQTKTKQVVDEEEELKKKKKEEEEEEEKKRKEQQKKETDGDLVEEEYIFEEDPDADEARFHRMMAAMYQEWREIHNKKDGYVSGLHTTEQQIFPMANDPDITSRVIKDYPGKPVDGSMGEVIKAVQQKEKIASPEEASRFFKDVIAKYPAVRMTTKVVTKKVEHQDVKRVLKNVVQPFVS